MSSGTADLIDGNVILKNNWFKFPLIALKNLLLVSEALISLAAVNDNVVVNFFGKKNVQAMRTAFHNFMALLKKRHELMQIIVLDSIMEI